VLTAVGVGETEVYATAANGRESNRITIVVPPSGLGVMYWQSDSTGTAQLYRANIDGTQRVRFLTSGFNDTDAAVSPDGTQIIFSTNRDGNYELYRVQSNGTGLTRLTSGGSNVYPAWSPDGSHIAWIRDNALWVMRADTTDKRALYTSQSARRPSFAGDSTVVFGANGVGIRRMQIGSATNTGVVTIWSTGGNDHWPAVSPDGQTIVVRHSNSTLYRLSISGADLTQISTITHGHVSWTRDGEWLLVSRATGSSYSLFLIRPDGTSPLRLTWGSGNNMTPATAP
jgi:Tol biopolymer transport system component